MNASISRGSVVVWVALLAGTAAAVTIETVPVGNPGNTGEWSGQSYGGYGPDRICGAVDYTYNIGKYEVTAGQYTEFLNKVAATDAYGLYNTSMWSSSYGCKIQRSGISGSYTYSVASDYANRPVNYVSWGDSARFANWLHNNQPTGPQGLSTTEDGAYYLNGATSECPASGRQPRVGLEVGDHERGRVVQGRVPQERRRDGQLLQLPDEQRQRARQPTDRS